MSESLESKFNLGERKIYAPRPEGYKCITAATLALHELMLLNEKITVATNDLAKSGGIASYSTERPAIAEDPSLKDRYYNLGLTEQATLSFLAGLAAAGFLPYYYTFAKFGLERPRDQLAMNVNSNLNIKYIFSHAFGLDLGQDGESHQVFGPLNLVPKARCPVIIPVDAIQADVVMRWSLTYPGAACILYGRNPVPIIEKEDKSIFFDKKYYEENPYDPSKADLIRDGTDATIISYGPIIHKALEARETLKRKYGYEIRLINFHCPNLGLIDKFEDWSCIREAAEDTGAILVVEEHYRDGGFGQKVAEFLLDEQLYVEFKSMAIPNHFKGTSGTPEELYSIVGLSEAHIRTGTAKLISRKRKS